MPSYRDATLPSYYATDFPLNVSSWKTSRELARIIMGKTTVSKMRVMEHAVAALCGLNGDAVLSRAAEIAGTERNLPIAEQNFGNLLAVLKSKVGIGEKDHEQIEEMFKFIKGTQAAKDNSTFKTLLNIAVDYARAYGITLQPSVYAYDAQHRPAGTVSSSSSSAAATPGTASAPSVTFTPLANQVLVNVNTAAEADDEDELLQAALERSLKP